MASTTDSLKKENDFDACAQENRMMAVDEWLKRWENKQIGFHKNEVHMVLKKHLNVLLHGKEWLKIFFPLCGKAVDMKWLAEMGHTIVGVEASEKAILEFFSEQHVSYSDEPVPEIPGAKVFKSLDGKISLYCCNFYEISSSVVGKFDGIWDRGSLVAINPCDRQRYSALIISLMEDGCCYLLDSFDYDPRLYKGPPFFIPSATIENLFGSSCNIKLLEAFDALTDRQREWGLDSFIEKVYLLTLKKNSI